MPVDIQQAVELLKRRAMEFAYLRLLLYILEADIDVRRMLEAFQRAPFLERHSVRVERSRERVQEQLKQVESEINGIVELLIKIARNEADGS